MDDMADRYASRGVTSVFIYTREAHPGERYRHHQSMDDKRAHAAAFVSHSGVRRRILLDDLEGSVHRAYGLLPNMTWIIGRRGTILYKASWTEPRDIEHALERAFEYEAARRRSDKPVPVYSERLAWRFRDDAAFRAGLERTGPQAVADFYGAK